MKRNTHVLLIPMSPNCELCLVIKYLDLNRILETQAIVLSDIYDSIDATELITECQIFTLKRL